MVNIDLVQEICIKENGVKIKDKGMENFIGPTVQASKENGWKII